MWSAKVRGTARHHVRFLARLERALEWADDPRLFEVGVDEISAWSVGEHLEHLLRSDRAIVEWLSEVVRGAAAGGSGPAAGSGGGPTWRGRLVLWTGFIPRGRGETPDLAAPRGSPRAEVEAGLRQLHASVVGLRPALPALAASQERLPHPVLGAFGASQWIRFAEVHHAHHERIVRDILEAEEGTAA